MFLRPGAVIIVGRALQLKLITNPVQLELSRWLPRPAGHRYDSALARRQIRYEANEAVRLFGAGRYHDLVSSMNRLVVNTNRYWPKRSFKAIEW